MLNINFYFLVQVSISKADNRLKRLEFILSQYIGKEDEKTRSERLNRTKDGVILGYKGRDTSFFGVAKQFRNEGYSITAFNVVERESEYALFFTISKTEKGFRADNHAIDAFLEFVDCRDGLAFSTFMNPSLKGPLEKEIVINIQPFRMYNRSVGAGFRLENVLTDQLMAFAQKKAEAEILSQPKLETATEVVTVATPVAVTEAAETENTTTPATAGKNGKSKSTTKAKREEKVGK